MVFRHVATYDRKSSKIVQNLEFSSASVTFRVTLVCVNMDSGNARTRFIRLLDELNRVVGFIFSCGHVFYPLHMASEISRNPLKCPQSLTEIARISTARNPNESYDNQIAAISIIRSNMPPGAARSLFDSV